MNFAIKPVISKEVKKSQELFKKELEKSYFDGQKDFLNGKILIKKENNKYFWNDNIQHLYNPEEAGDDKIGK